jgi:acyl CoA:acetate/3-ketoacid CoA transferase beta subunit
VPELSPGSGFVRSVAGKRAVVMSTLIGGLQVDEEGHLPNVAIPGEMVPGMGGAMGLASGAKRVNN